MAEIINALASVDNLYALIAIAIGVLVYSTSRKRDDIVTSRIGAVTVAVSALLLCGTLLAKTIPQKQEVAELDTKIIKLKADSKQEGCKYGGYLSGTHSDGERQAWPLTPSDVIHVEPEHATGFVRLSVNGSPLIRNGTPAGVRSIDVQMICWIPVLRSIPSAALN